MFVVCNNGNFHRVRPRVVGDESPLTPQELCQLSLPLEHEGFDWGQAQFGVVQFVGGCVSYVEKSFDASVVKPFNGVCLWRVRSHSNTTETT